MKVKWLLLSVLILAISDVASAQTDTKVLRGISKVMLIVEALSEEAAKCGIDKGAVSQAVLFPLSSSRLRIVKDRGADVFVLYLNVNFLFLPEVGGCTYDVLMQLSQPQFVRTPLREKFLNVEYWHDGSIAVAPRGDAKRQISASLDSVTKRFLIDWNLDQK